ncbi:MAG: nucleotidyltransferase [Kiritimatiellae bacterium]|nr:nucleotidyltransferase [Kiritimatiellia bacterium]
MPDLQGLLTRLIENEVDFVVVGGFAAVAHGGTLLTQDVDVCCDFSPDNLMRLQQAVADLHPVHRMTPARLPLELTPEKCRGLKNLYLDTDYGQLDCLGNVMGLGDFPDVKRGSIEVRLEAGACRILSIDDLIKAKEAMGRPRDKETVLQLRAIREKRPDAES